MFGLMQSLCAIFTNESRSLYGNCTKLRNRPSILGDTFTSLLP